jgi:CheY-like chemotaxis protein
LVDDDRLVLESVRAALEATGHRVWMTDSAERALAMARALEPDVVVTDYRMPAIDGLALLQALNEQMSPPRMVIYSAEPRPRGRTLAGERGIIWVAKTSGHTALLESLDDMLGGEA